ncbi:hypothetical protein ACMFMG_001234 [Clarireedia jacksonii]
MSTKGELKFLLSTSYQLQGTSSKTTSITTYITTKICLEDVSIISMRQTTTAIANIMALAPPQLSAAELKAQEAEASQTVQRVIVGAILLYLCMFIFFRLYTNSLC